MLLLESPLELLELLLELGGSEPGSAGGASDGNGCSSAADFRDESGVGASGESMDGAAGLGGSPGKGNCSALDGCFASRGGVQGLSPSLAEFWLAGGQGWFAGFWGGVA